MESRSKSQSTDESIAIGSGTTVGVIPYYLGGGISAYSPFIGYACENIISAKFVSSKGELIHVSETSHPELFWGIRGAGQFLGLFTSLTIKIHPYAKLGTDQEAQRTIATLAFTVDKLDSVAAALLEITESKEHVSAGHFSVAQAPPDLKLQVLLVAPQIFAPPEVAEKVLQSLVELGPIMQMVGPSTFSTHSDHMEYLCAKGDFKRFTQNGMSHGFDVENFRSLVKLHAEYIAACPDAARSGFTVEWHTPYTGEKVDCAFGLGEVEYWLSVHLPCPPFARLWLINLNFTEIFLAGTRIRRIMHMWRVLIRRHRRLGVLGRRRRTLCPIRTRVVKAPLSGGTRDRRGLLA